MTAEELVQALDPALEGPRSVLIASLRNAVPNERVVDAMAAVRRDLFVPSHYRDQAYEDRALSIGSGQTISQPRIVAAMSAALDPGPGDTVLDEGTGSGYQAAVLALLARRVVSVERVAALVDSAGDRLQRLGYTNVDAHLAGDELGWPSGAPYDGIVVGAAAPSVPGPLVCQLAPGGTLVVPVGSRDHQNLMRVTLDPDGNLSVDELGGCQFVPLIGPGGWRN